MYVLCVYVARREEGRGGLIIKWPVAPRLTHTSSPPIADSSFYSHTLSCAFFILPLPFKLFYLFGPSKGVI